MGADVAVGDPAPASSTCGRRSLAPSAQLRPIASGCAWRTEYQNASAVWPDSVRPEASVIVPEIITGRRPPRVLEHLLDREQRGLGVERVEDGLDHQHVGAAVDQALDGFAVGPRSSSKLIARKPGSFTSGLSEAVRLVGPSTPITKRGLSGRLRASAASQASRGNARAFAVEFAHQVLQVVVGQRDRGGVEGVGLDQVGAGVQVGACGCRAIMSGRVSVSRSLLPRWSWPQPQPAPCACVGIGQQAVVAFGEALAAVVGFLQFVALDHRAHRAVDDQDALGQRGFERGDAFGMQPGQGMRLALVGSRWGAATSCGDQRDHFEMRRALLAGHGFAVCTSQAGLVDEPAQFLVAEAEVDVAVGLDHAAVFVPGQAGQQQAAAGAQHARGFGHRLRGLVGIGQRVHQHHQVEAARRRRAGRACRPRALRRCGSGAGARWRPTTTRGLVSMQT